MKNNYSMPDIEVEILLADEIIRTSGGEWELPEIGFHSDSIDPSNVDRG